MSKKTILICLAAIAVLLIAVAVAVAVLYSGVGDDSRTSLDDSRYGLVPAVPADAVAVFRFDSMDDMVSLLSGTPSVAPFVSPDPSSPFARFVSALGRMSSEGKIPLHSSQAVVSNHYIGSPVPLVVVDAGRSGSSSAEDAAALAAVADSAGMYSEVIDCKEILSSDSWLSRRTLLLASPSSDLVKSSRRHIARKISILDSDGFASAAISSEGRNIMLLCTKEADKLSGEILSGRYRRYSDFIGEAADWLAFSFYSADAGHVYLKGGLPLPEEDEKFLSVFGSLEASSSRISSMLPSYTVFAASLPLADPAAYVGNYRHFKDASSGTAGLQAESKALEKSTGISPDDWYAALDVKEVAVASFYVGSELENVVLVRTGKADESILLKDTGAGSMDEYVPEARPYLFSGYAGVCFGSIFRIPDESCSAIINGWIVSGSAAGVREYVSGRALENSLAHYMSDAGLSDRLSMKNRCFVSYFSASESDAFLKEVFTGQYAQAFVSSLESVTYEPLTFSIEKTKGGLQFYAEMDRTTVTKSKAPVFERDTVVSIPRGPFRVKNSGTGRMNLFYQQDNMYLCLQEEDGKGLWGAPFSTPICGRAGTVDYFANGKLQILFASGSKLYLIDRLGRFVNPFPVDLKKRILLGPDIYDFNGKRKYNVMVLHDDNTIDMYNLQGEKPDQWKGITAEETIKGLPEPLKVGGKTFWIVRTSLQTLIFPFYGGESLAKAEGDKMIRSDSKVIPSGSHSVTVTCYDGKERTLEL